MEILTLQSIVSLKTQVKTIMSGHNYDAAHDFHHIMRVYTNAQNICKEEKQANEKLVLYAVLLHDIVSYPKSDKRSGLASVHSAKQARQILADYDLTLKEVDVISDAIYDHSFSQNTVPRTIEGKILQDSDRLDALGSIGIARVFATGGLLKRPFYNTDDPFCKTRSPDDTVWTVDHFFSKLLKLEGLMNTKAGRTEANRRTRILKEFLDNLKQDLAY